MRIMHIGRELICITYVHTECIFTTICFECTFSQSTSIGGLKVNYIMTWNDVSVIFLSVISCVKKRMIREKLTSITLLLHLGKVLYLLSGPAELVWLLWFWLDQFFLKVKAKFHFYKKLVINEVLVWFWGLLGLLY